MKNNIFMKIGNTLYNISTCSTISLNGSDLLIGYPGDHDVKCDNNILTSKYIFDEICSIVIPVDMDKNYVRNMQELYREK